MSKPEEEQVPAEGEAEANAEEQEVEEPVDLELQQKMKNLTLDEKMFGEDEKNKKEKGEDSNKKSKKAKGQDFLDYANKNNIQIDIQYEQDKANPQKKKGFGNQGYQPYNKKPGFKKNFQKEGGNQPMRGNNRGGRGGFVNRPAGFQGRPYHPKTFQMKMGANKFDYPPAAMMPMIQPENRMTVQLQTDQDVIGYLQDLFSEESLNKDIFIRGNLSEDGKINIVELEKYYGLKNNKVTKEKIAELAPQVVNIDLVEEGENKYIAVKDFQSFSANLTPLQELRNRKKQNRMRMMNQQMMMPMMPDMMGYGMPPSYSVVSMQNNYFFNQQQQPPMYGMQQGFPQNYPQQP
ncbi:MAG: hypothetical protein MJ252_10780 [archaeon]|nr:hypothetical protein [archaeon]